MARADMESAPTVDRESAGSAGESGVPDAPGVQWRWQHSVGNSTVGAGHARPSHVRQASICGITKNKKDVRGRIPYPPALTLTQNDKK